MCQLFDTLSIYKHLSTSQEINRLAVNIICKITYVCQVGRQTLTQSPHYKYLVKSMNMCSYPLPLSRPKPHYLVEYNVGKVHRQDQSTVLCKTYC